MYTASTSRSPSPVTLRQNKHTPPATPKTAQDYHWESETEFPPLPPGRSSCGTASPPPRGLVRPARHVKSFTWSAADGMRLLSTHQAMRHICSGNDPKASLNAIPNTKTIHTAFLSYEDALHALREGLAAAGSTLRDLGIGREHEWEHQLKQTASGVVKENGAISEVDITAVRIRVARCCGPKKVTMKHYVPIGTKKDGTHPGMTTG